MSDNDQREFQLAFHDQCCPEGGECRSRSIHSWTYGWFDGEEYLDALPASLLQASLDGRTQAGSDATTRTNARATPTRIQRRRTKGWRTPECSCGCGEGARYVGRGSRWGNPWRVSRTPGDVDMWRVTDGRTVVYRSTKSFAQQAAAEWFRVGLSPDDIATMDELRGHDLMCWCSLDSPCHANVLLEMANR